MRNIHKAVEQPEPVAIVSEVHMSRYTIEWTNGPLSEGTKLFAAPPSLEPEQSEPFIYLDPDTGETWTVGAIEDGCRHVDGLIALYTHPPRREPLSDGQMKPSAEYVEAYETPKSALETAPSVQIPQLTETDESCTEIYKAANQETVKSQPLTTKRIFAAMRYVENLVRKQIGAK